MEGGKEGGRERGERERRRKTERPKLYVNVETEGVWNSLFFRISSTGRRSGPFLLLPLSTTQLRGR